MIAKMERQRQKQAQYGAKPMKGLSAYLTRQCGNWFSKRNLRFMRRFYNAFPIRHALRTELTWTHYRLLMRLEEPNRREFF